MNIKDKTIVISLGGSIIVPQSGIDVSFLKEFDRFVRDKVTLGWKFYIITGGGITSRNYQKAAREIETLTDEDMDWLGIHATRLNGHLLRSIFKDIAYPKVIHHFDKLEEIEEPVAIASGWKPGRSTDYDAVLMARKFGIKTLLNLSDIAQVYDKDPKIYPEAKPVDKLNWDQFKEIVGTKWSPGLNAPFDPVAAELASEIGLKVVISEGRNFKNLEKFFSGEEFVGTTIE